MQTFFAVAACSWMPHWACHYYRLETKSDFVVGSWSFSSMDSFAALAIYGGLVIANVVALRTVNWRIAVATLTGVGHLVLGLLHAYRLIYPFTFRVFGYEWSRGASLRETLIVVPFGLLSLGVAIGLTHPPEFQRRDAE